MQRSLLLVVTAEPLAAALLGAAVEAAGLSVAFPRRDEAPRDALRRTRPTTVLAAVTADGLDLDPLLGPALMLDARVILIGGRRAERVMREAASQHGLAAFLLPDQLDALLDELRASVERDMPRAAERTEA